jgi:hypothetical protein
MQTTMSTPWRTSTYSSGNGGQCVEAGNTTPSAVLVRDTVNRDGGTLAFSPSAWRAFTEKIRSGN